MRAARRGTSNDCDLGEHDASRVVANLGTTMKAVIISLTIALFVGVMYQLFAESVGVAKSRPSSGAIIGTAMAFASLLPIQLDYQRRKRLLDEIRKRT